MTMTDLTLLLACPKCHESLPANNGPMRCPVCELGYGKKGVVYDFICRELYGSQDEYEKIRAVIEFWGNGWEKRMTEDDHNFLNHKTKIELEEFMVDFGSFHKENNFLFGNEVCLDDLKNKISLNIGCGAGAESAFLVYHGSSCIALDVTSQAVGAAWRLMDTLDAKGMGIQADSRFLPLLDESVDLVYSSGVLHHSPNINRSVNEIHRVLRQGGKAYIMLYATYSLMFLQPRLIGLLKGHISKGRQLEYMSRDSERDWETADRTNPYTETFSVRQCRELFSDFRKVSVRKGGFDLKQIRVVGCFFNNDFLNSMAKRLLERQLGACLFISAEK
jgi:ubiquinone/menaquinone biosynthesis C-methylase UbiE